MGLSMVMRFLLILTCCVCYLAVEEDSCDADADSILCDIPPGEKNNQSPTRLYSPAEDRRYLLYDVNPGEGFNLRRDVYIRVANIIWQILEANLSKNWILVLPPWGPLYHWRNTDIGLQEQIPWAHFFDLGSLSRYIPIMEMREFLEEQFHGLDMVYYLQHDTESSNSSTVNEVLNTIPCEGDLPYKKRKHKYRGWFWGYESLYSNHVKCLSVQGTSSTLLPLLIETDMKTIMIDRAEVILHDSFGDVSYWMARRSMRFSRRLQSFANEFRWKYLNSTDDRDKTRMHNNWLQHYVQTRPAIGGPYLAVHLRRRDYLKAKPEQVPSIKHAAQQIKEKLEELELEKVFVATDAPASEFIELKEYVPSVIQFNPEPEVQESLKDGGIAIVDQWICAHARYFMGTYESTFSFRIHEEREILGFPPYTTFNRFCGDNETKCTPPTQWIIKYP